MYWLEGSCNINRNELFDLRFIQRYAASTCRPARSPAEFSEREAPSRERHHCVNDTGRDRLFDLECLRCLDCCARRELHPLSFCLSTCLKSAPTLSVKQQAPMAVDAFIVESNEKLRSPLAKSKFVPHLACLAAFALPGPTSERLALGEPRPPRRASEQSEGAAYTCGPVGPSRTGGAGRGCREAAGFVLGEIPKLCWNLRGLAIRRVGRAQGRDGGLGMSVIPAGRTHQLHDAPAAVPGWPLRIVRSSRQRAAKVVLPPVNVVAGAVASKRGRGRRRTGVAARQSGTSSLFGRAVASSDRHARLLGS